MVIFWDSASGESGTWSSEMIEDIVKSIDAAKVRSHHSRRLNVPDERAIEGENLAFDDDTSTDAIEGRADGRALR